jgi:deoxyribodipyrimidine photo-lyase
MAEKLKSFAAGSAASYYPYVEESVGAGKGLIGSLGKLACVIVTDDFPCFFLPQMIRSAAKLSACRFEAVDSNGLLPLRAASKAFATAFSFRSFLQKNLPQYLAQSPNRNPFARLNLPSLKSLPAKIINKWPPTSTATLAGRDLAARLPIRHEIGTVALRGGELAARAALRKFLSERLGKYLEFRNEPEAKATSGLSPYLHFGHISSHQIFHELMNHENWSEEKLALRSNGSRAGWWNTSASAEAFLDQFVTWRELGFNFSSHRDDDSHISSLPDWTLKTLAKHARDERVHIYSLEQFAEARTHDPLWNAAQRQLVKEGRIHNICEWSGERKFWSGRERPKKR